MQSDSRRVVLQKDLSSKDYSDLMMDELEDLHMIRLRALENIEKNRTRVAKYYMKDRYGEPERGGGGVNGSR
jgi:hypothetical protein